MDYSRLSKRRQKNAQTQTILFIVGSIVAIIVVAFFGIKIVFGLSGFLSERFMKKSGSVSEINPAPTTPVFSNEFEATKSAMIKLKGVADPNTNVELFANGESKTSGISDDKGDFLFEINLDKGANEFKAQATSSKGVKSEMSEPYLVSLLTAPPTLNITSPKDGDNVNEKLTPITGTTDKGVQITINDFMSIVDDKGNFSFGYNLNDGDNKIKVVATDAAGNQTTKEITVKYSP